MIDPRFVLVGAALSLLGALVYARAVLAGQAVPNRVTWFVWALAPLVGFAAQLAAGAGIAAVTALSIGLGPAIVFAASFSHGAGYWRLRPFDVGCGALALVALVAWRVTGEGVVGVALSALADGLAAVPTVVKAWRAPETENHAVFRNAALNGAISLLALQRRSAENVIFPIYLVVLGSVLWGLIRLPRAARGGPGAATRPVLRRRVGRSGGGRPRRR